MRDSKLCQHLDRDKMDWCVNCPNMKSEVGDTDMEYERYECLVCGERTKLDYSEMQ